MSSRMRQVEIYDAVEEAGEDIAVCLAEDSTGILPAAERKAIEEQFQLWEFGKWALLGDSSAQHIKRRLQYQARIKEAPTFWQSIIPMSEDDGFLMDSFISGIVDRKAQKVLLSQYEYHQSEAAGARVLRLTAHDYRITRDKALRKLRDAVETA